MAESLSRAAGLALVDDVGEPCQEAFDDWLVVVGIPGIVYKVEHAALPALCARHLPGLEALLRSANGAVRPS